MADNGESQDQTSGTDDKGQSSTDSSDKKDDSSLDKIDESNFDADRARETIRRQREAEADLRRQNAEMAQRLKQLDDAKLTETERLQKERDEAVERAKKLEEEHQKRELRDAVVGIAKDQKFRDPDDAYLFIASKVETDDQGKPKNAEALLSELAKSKPYLIRGRQSADGGAQDDEPKKSGNEEMNARLRAAAGRGR